MLDTLVPWGPDSFSTRLEKVELVDVEEVELGSHLC